MLERVQLKITETARSLEYVMYEERNGLVQPAEEKAKGKFY